MRKLIITISAGLVAAVAATVLFVVFHKSYGDYANECAAALANHVYGKPAACKHISEDDYNALMVSQSIDDLGWTDENGDFDPNKMLEDTLND